MTNRYRLAATVTLALLGCATPKESAPQPAAVRRPGAGPIEAGSAHEAAAKPHRAPVVTTVVGPDRVARGETFEVRIVVEKTVHRLPLRLAVTLPPGTELVRGATQEELDTDSLRIERTLVLRVTGDVPASDVVVAVEGGGAGFGTRATGTYRFGRPEPKLPQPPRSDTPLIVSGRSLGKPIPLGK